MSIEPSPTRALIDVQNHNAERLAELQELDAALRARKVGLRSFQTLHFADRRRVQSHNPYRISRNLRGPIVRELESAPTKPSRRPRRDRRRPVNLAQHFGARESNGLWLENHLWLTKRMHMTERWGFKLPVKPTQKCSRRQFRYSCRRCVIHDASYMSVRQLPLEILEDLIDFTRPGPGGAKCLTKDSPSGVYNCSLKAGPDQCTDLPCEIVLDAQIKMFLLITHPLLNSQVEHLLSTCEEKCEFKHNKINTVFFELFGPESLSTLRSALLAAEVEVMHSDKEEVKRARKILNESINNSKFLYEVNDKKFFVIRSHGVPRVLGPFNPPKLRPQAPALAADATSDVMARYILENARIRNSCSTIFNQGSGNTLLDKSLTYKLSLRSKRRKDTKRTAAQLRTAKSETEAVIAPGLKTKIMIWFNCLNKTLISIRVLIPRNTIGRSLWVLLNRYGALPLGIDCRRHIMTTHNLLSFPEHYIQHPRSTEYWDLKRREALAKWLRTPKSKRENFQKTEPANNSPFGLWWQQVSDLSEFCKDKTDPDCHAESISQISHKPSPRFRVGFAHWQARGSPKMYKLLYSAETGNPVGQILDSYHSLLTGKGLAICVVCDGIESGVSIVDCAGQPVIFFVV